MTTHASTERFAQDLTRFAEWTETVWFANKGTLTLSPQAGELVVMTLGLGGEAGEVQEAVLANDQQELQKELGDVIYYWARQVRFHGLDPLELAQGVSASSPSHDDAQVVQALRLGKATSRVQEIVKKGFRDGRLDDTGLKRALGDTLQAWAGLARSAGLDLSGILSTNQEKILARKAAGQLRGSDGADGQRVAPTGRKMGC